MHLQNEHIAQLDRFLDKSQFTTKGAVITDLDGTAVHEHAGRTIIHKSVETGLKKIYEYGRPVIINTLRFPLSVIRTFAVDWYRISNSRIPVILLNGSQLGYIEKNNEQYEFKQIASTTIPADEIMLALQGVKQLLDEGIRELVFFYYPEDWTKGEIVWTPLAERIPFLQDKYKSASSVISTSFEELQKFCLERPLCMIFLLIEVPGDRLMAYQHVQKQNFITRNKVDKLFGVEQMAALLNFDLYHSIGAGDSAMDSFLNGVGLSVHVGNKNLPFSGMSETIRLDGFQAFGDLLHHCASRQKLEIS